MVEIPPLSRDEARLLLSRNAARYFVGITEPQTVGLLASGRRAPSHLPRHHDQCGSGAAPRRDAGEATNGR